MVARVVLSYYKHYSISVRDISTDYNTHTCTTTSHCYQGQHNNDFNTSLFSGEENHSPKTPLFKLCASDSPGKENTKRAKERGLGLLGGRRP